MNVLHELPKMTGLSLCVALLLGALVLGSSNNPASAQQPGDTLCVVGDFVDGNCAVSTVAECLPDSCFVEATRPSAPIVEPAERVPGPCPDGAVVEGGFYCFLYTARGPASCPDDAAGNRVWICPGFELALASCAVGSVQLWSENCAQPVDRSEGPYDCPRSGTLDTTVQPPVCSFADELVLGLCPTGSEAFNGVCAAFGIDGLSANCGLLNEDSVSLRCLEAADPYPDDATICQPGTTYLGGACAIEIDALVTEPCDYPGTTSVVFIGNLCEATQPPAIATCPSAFSRDTIADEQWGPACYRFYPAELAEEGVARCETGALNEDQTACLVPATIRADADPAICPSGYAPDAVTAVCTRSVPALVGPDRCPSGARGPVNGCYLEGPARFCPSGELIGPLDCLAGNTAPITLEPGRLVCVDLSAALVDGVCKTLARPTADTSACHPGFTLTAGECRQALNNTSGLIICSDASAELVDTTCVMTTDFVQQPTASDYECQQGVLTGSMCTVTASTVGGYYCPQGNLNVRACVVAEPFLEFVCPAGFSRLESVAGCEGALPANPGYRCAGSTGSFLVSDQVPQCWEPSGPQPGSCPGVVDANEQCFAFVDHALTCLPDQCRVAAVAAAPPSERGDVDCNDVIDVRDVYRLALALADPMVGRESSCDDVVTVDELRITASDVVGDGTVNRLDAQRMLNCIVNDDLSNCTN